jgi:hypothetical protein
MIALRERIVNKLEYLPESNLRQVLSFVEFLTGGPRSWMNPCYP